MKKIFFTLLSFVLLSFGAVQAQQDVTVRFGGSVGFNMSKWGGDSSDELKTSFKPGFQIGGLGEMIINKKWSIQPEILFSYQGTNSDVLDKGVSVFYLKTPLVVYRNFAIAKGAGRLSPGLGFYCAEGLFGEFNGDSNIGAYMGRFDWGLDIRMNYEIQKGKISGLYAGVGFSQGFNESRITTIGLSVGYKFKESEWLSSTYYKSKRAGVLDKGYQD